MQQGSPTTPIATEPQFYTLVCVELIVETTIKVPGKKPEVATYPIRENVLSISATGKTGVHEIARIQQAAQMQFHQKMEDPMNTKILNVVLLSMMPLGEFTPEEFNKRPEGLKVQEKAPEPKMVQSEAFDQLLGKRH